jgi:hypothetical protein
MVSANFTSVKYRENFLFYDNGVTDGRGTVQRF